MSPPKKKSGSGTRPAAVRSGRRSGPARSGTGRPAGGKAGASPVGGRKPPARSPSGADDAGSVGGVAEQDPAGAPALVVGTIPPLTRVAGGLGLAAAVLLVVQPAFPLVRAGGRGLGGAHNLWDYVVPLPAALLVGAAGVLCLLGRLPRLGLGGLVAAGGYGLGQLFRTAALLDTGGHTSIDLPLPEGLVRSFRYRPGAGLVLQVTALAALAVVLLLALLAWRRTVMDDDGSFDPLRPTFAALGLAGGLTGFAAVALPPANPVPGGLTIVVPSLFERSGLDLLGGWLLAVAVVTVAVGAATVRPRLAVVGMFAGLAAMFGTAALGDLLLVVRSTALDLDTGTGFQVAAAVVFAALSAGAWRITRRPAAPPD